MWIFCADPAPNTSGQIRVSTFTTIVTDIFQSSY